MSIDWTSNNLSFQNTTDVIWIETGFIGDVILCTSGIHALHQLSPNIQQHIITTPNGASVLANHPYLKSIHVFDKRTAPIGSMWLLKKQIRRLKLNSPVILQSHRSFRSSLLAKYLGFPVVTYQETSGSILATKTVPRIATMHETDRISLLLEPFGFSRKQLKGFRPILKSFDGPFSQKLTSAKKWIAIVPGSIWPTKRWPIGKFTSIAQILLEDQTFGVVLLGSKEDSAQCNFIYDSYVRSRPKMAHNILNLCGQTTITDLNSIYPKLNGIIANDSSSTHFASAFNIPTVTIFGATLPSMGFGPLGNRSQIVEVANLACRPCSAHGPEVCPLTHFKCMNDLTVEMVHQAFLKTRPRHQE